MVSWFCVLRQGFHGITLAGLEPAVLHLPLPPSVGIKGVGHHAWLGNQKKKKLVGNV